MLPTLAIGISYGVLAEPVLGKIAPIVASVVVFAGAAQFASLGVLAAAGGAGAAIVAGLMMNARFLPIGFAVAPALKGRPLRRAAEGQTVVDASFAIARKPDGTFDRGVLIGSTIPQAAGWMGGTAIGVFAGSAISDPGTFGLDALFPAFFLALLVEEARGGLTVTVAVLGAAIMLALMSFVPVGLAIVIASAAALLGLRRPAA